jgi:hypothetical protein
LARAGAGARGGDRDAAGLGERDVRHHGDCDTATISFELPAGVWLTSALGAVVPEPSLLVLVALGLLVPLLRRRPPGRA